MRVRSSVAVVLLLVVVAMAGNIVVPGGVAVGQVVDRMLGLAALGAGDCAGSYAITDGSDSTKCAKINASAMRVLFDAGGLVNWDSFRVYLKIGTSEVCTANVQEWRIQGSNDLVTWVDLTAFYNVSVCDRTVPVVPENSDYQYISWYGDGGVSCASCKWHLYTISGYGTPVAELTPPTATNTTTPTVTDTPTVTRTPTTTPIPPTSTPWANGTPQPVLGPCGAEGLPPCHVYWQTPGPVYWETPMPITGSVTIDNWPTPIPTATTWAGGGPQLTALAVSQGATEDQALGFEDEFNDFGYDNPVTGHRDRYVLTSLYSGPCFDLGLFFNTGICFNYRWIMDFSMGPINFPAWPFLIIVAGVILRFLIQR